MIDVPDDEDFEELYGEWDPSLYKVAMAGERHFALLIGGPRWDDPYTIILRRDTVGKTFSRDDVRRELMDIHAIPQDEVGDSSEPSYVAISRNGNVYVLGPQTTEHFVIPGTPAESEDVPDMFFHSILPHEGRYLVAGSDGFLKLGNHKIWEDIAPHVEIEHPYSSPDWRILGTGSNSDVFIVGTQTADPKYFNLYPGHPEYDEKLSGEALFKIDQRLMQEKMAVPRVTVLFTGRPGRWKRQALPERIARSMPAYSYLSDVASDESGFDYVIGSDGLVMKGTPETGFSDISFVGDRERHFNFGVPWGKELVLATDTGLFCFDGHLATPFVPKVKVRSAPYVVQPSAVVVRDGMLRIFDYRLRYFTFNGAEWSQYNLPVELSERPFRGGMTKE